MEQQSNAPAGRVGDLGFWRELWHQARLVWYLLRDPQVPVYLKLVPLASLLYLVIPIDFLFDWIPLFGQLDDLTALIVGAKMFIELAPQERVAHHEQTMRQQRPRAGAAEGQAGNEPVVIEGEFERMNGGQATPKRPRR
ncbi:MAG: YkvA family protein [Candidatus Promineifilaceae bacterium]